MMLSLLVVVVMMAVIVGGNHKPFNLNVSITFEHHPKLPQNTDCPFFFFFLNFFGSSESALQIEEQTYRLSSLAFPPPYLYSKLTHSKNQKKNIKYIECGEKKSLNNFHYLIQSYKDLKEMAQLNFIFSPNVSRLREN
ncbi:hypothetical protein NH340_JMT00694 [Sarcoptes scabiei]|nr:hypothetical protein NH340_JMT00694 [Sarcoptes scabiei]